MRRLTEEMTVGRGRRTGMRCAVAIAVGGSGAWYLHQGSEPVRAVRSSAPAAIPVTTATVTKRDLPIYLTEFGVQSKPNKYLGVPVGEQAENDAIAEHIAWSNPRVAAFSQYLLKDDPLGGAPGAGVNGGTVGFQTGLEYVNGRPKPLYYGWPVPLTVSKQGHGFSLWGLVRPATGATKVTVLVQAKGARRYRKLKTVSTDSMGYWAFSSATQGAHWRVRWVSPSGQKYEGPPIRAH